MASTMLQHSRKQSSPLENIRRKLAPHLPASVQAYNAVMLALSDDGIERRVVSSPHLEQNSSGQTRSDIGPGSHSVSMALI